MGDETFVGIDFGTSNSAVAVCASVGPAELVQFEGDHADSGGVMRSVLYFEPGGAVSSGTPAINRYLENESEGRLVQSIKSYLASKSFERTVILDRSWRLSDIVGRFVRALRDSSARNLGSRAVVGRPVRYWGAETDEDDQRAVKRMREAMALAGFDDVEFVPEPVAAASSYAARVSTKQRAVIADFGGGTSDFSVLEVEPKASGQGGAVRILANAGIGIGGDSFDAEVIDHAVAPLLGKGSTYRDAFGAETLVPVWLFQRLRRWHLLSLLKSPKTMALLERVSRGSSAPEAIERLRILVDEDLGLALHRSVEKLKVTLSSVETGTLMFSSPGVSVARQVPRDSFEQWIAGELAKVRTTLGEALALAKLGASDIDCVFATGGSSLVPAIRGLLGEALPRAEIVGGEELTSVASGLALVSRAKSMSSVG